MKFVISRFKFFCFCLWYAGLASSQESADSRRIDPRSDLIVHESATKPKKHLWSLILHTPFNLADSGRLLGLEGSYAYHYGEFWPTFSFQQVRAQSEKVAFSARSEWKAEPLPLDDLIGITVLGAGLSYPSDWVQDLVDEDKLFTISTASLNYVMMADGNSDNNYSGWGLRADFGVHYRPDVNWHYGLKASYHLSKVKRPVDTADTADAIAAHRSVLLSWPSLGFDLSLYF